MSLVITRAVSPNVTGQPGPHGPHVTAAVESAYNNALGRIIFQHSIDHLEIISHFLLN